MDGGRDGGGLYCEKWKVGVGFTAQVQFLFHFFYFLFFLLVLSWLGTEAAGFSFRAGFLLSGVGDTIILCRYHTFGMEVDAWVT